MNLLIKIRRFIREILLKVRYQLLKLYGYDIDKTARISLGAFLDKTNPSGIHIGPESYIASKSIIFSHDFARGLHKDTYIGRRSFIGASSIIMCGVKIGDNCIIGAGAVVTKDVPSHCIVAGNPAIVIRQDIQTKSYGQLIK